MPRNPSRVHKGKGKTSRSIKLNRSQRLKDENSIRSIDKLIRDQRHLTVAYEPSQEIKDDKKRGEETWKDTIERLNSIAKLSTRNNSDRNNKPSGGKSRPKPVEPHTLANLLSGVGKINFSETDIPQAHHSRNETCGEPVSQSRSVDDIDV